MNGTRIELAGLLRQDLRNRIPAPTPAEEEIIDALADYGSFGPTLFVAPYSRQTLESLHALAQNLSGGLVLLGTHRVAGCRLEHYLATASHLAEITQMIVAPAGHA